MRSPGPPPKTMHPTPHRPHRTTIPATGLGSIVVATPQLALVADRCVVADVAVAVGMGGGAFSAIDRRPWPDATRGGGDAPVLAGRVQADAPVPAGRVQAAAAPAATTSTDGAFR